MVTSTLYHYILGTYQRTCLPTDDELQSQPPSQGPSPARRRITAALCPCPEKVEEALLVLDKARRPACPF